MCAYYSALLGGMLFWAGAYLAVVEALNVGHKVRTDIAVLRGFESGVASTIAGHS